MNGPNNFWNEPQGEAQQAVQPLEMPQTEAPATDNVDRPLANDEMALVQPATEAEVAAQARAEAVKPPVHEGPSPEVVKLDEIVQPVLTTSVPAAKPKANILVEKELPNSLSEIAQYADEIGEVMES